MNKKQYLTSLFNKYQEENLRTLENFYTKKGGYTEEIVIIFPYLLGANFYYIPGFKKDFPSLS